MPLLRLADPRAKRVQDALVVEKALANTLTKTYRSIITNRYYPQSIYTLHRIYDKIVYNAIRSAATDVYQIAIKYVNDKYKADPFLTTTDIDIIKQRTKKSFDSFWRKIQLSINKTYNLLPEEYSKIDISYMISAVATGTTTGLLALGTISKIRQFERGKLYPLVGAAAIDESEDFSLDEGVDFGTGDIPTVTWIAIGDRSTCDTCAEYDGQEWDYNDADIPVPSEACEGGDNCRCVIELA